MTPSQRILSVLNTLRNTKARLEMYNHSNAEVTEQIRQIEDDLQNGSIEMPSEDSPLVARVKAFEQLQHVRQYLYNAKCISANHDGIKSQMWIDLRDAVVILRDQEAELRKTIAKCIGAVVGC